jgi:hypothetical protein
MQPCLPVTVKEEETHTQPRTEVEHVPDSDTIKDRIRRLRQSKGGNSQWRVALPS